MSEGTDTTVEDIDQSNPSNLNETQQDTLQHLQEVVSSSVDQVTLVSVLEECEWNIERAVNKVFGLPDTNVRQRNLGSPESTVPMVNLLPPNQRIVRTTNNSEQSYWWWALFLFVEPLRLSCNVIYSVVRFFTSFLWPDSRSHVTDPVGDVRRFIQDFRTNYVGDNVNTTTGRILDTPSPTIPPFFEDSYESALREAKRSLRYLIVYLHGDSHEDTREFCHKTLQNPIVLEFLRKSDQLIFWGCNIKSPEGYRVSRTLREHTYPFIGVIGLTNLVASDDGSRYGTDSIGMALLGRIEGATKPSYLVEQLERILNDHQGATIAARVERQEREVTVLLRREQDDAYQRSLEADRAKFAAREAERHLEAEKSAQIENESKRIEQLASARRRRQSWWKEQLPTEPDHGVRYIVKMPNGCRFSRVFSPTDSIKLLYYFILSHEESPKNFEVQSNFPKSLLPCQPADESDLDDYIEDENKANVDDSYVIQKSPPCSDWTPKSENDPPSFEKLGLCKPQVLFVVDKDA